MVMKDRLLGLPRTMTVLKQVDADYEGVATRPHTFPQAVSDNVQPGPSERVLPV